MIEDLKKLKQNALNYDEFKINAKPNAEEMLLIYLTFQKDKEVYFNEFLKKVKFLSLDNNFFDINEIIKKAKEKLYPILILKNDLLDIFVILEPIIADNRINRVDVIVLVSKNIIDPISVISLVLEAISSFVEGFEYD